MSQQTILNPYFFYEYIISNEGHSNEFALLAIKNKYPNIKLKIFDSFGEYQHQQEEVFNSESNSWIEEKQTYGCFEYKTTQVDTNRSYDHYVEIFKLQIMGFKEQEEDLKNMMNDYARALSGLMKTSEMVGDEKYDFFFYLGDNSGTATWNDPQDINGAEMIIGTMMILIEVSTTIVNSNLISLYSPDFQETIPYNSMKVSIKNENTRDTGTSSYHYRFINERAVKSLSFAGKYFDSNFCNFLYRQSILPTDESITLELTNEILKDHYELVDNAEGNPKENGYYEVVDDKYVLTNDTSIVSGKDYYQIDSAYKVSGSYLVYDVAFSFSYGAPVSYNVSFIPAMEV